MKAKQIDINNFLILDSATLYEAVDKMEINKKGFLAIEDSSNKKIVGILTDPDIRRLIIKKVDFYRKKINEF